MKRTTRLHCVLTASLGAVSFGGVSTAPAKEKQLVTISYLLRPSQPIADNIKSVAVIDAGVESRDAGQGNARERKWAAIAAELIEAMVQSAPPEEGNAVTVVQRRATKKILEEQDLQLAGIVEGNSATRACKLLSVQGLIMSKIAIHVDMRRREKSTIDWVGFLGSGVGGRRQPADPRFRRDPRGPMIGNPYRGRGGPGGFQVPTKTITEISRNLTVQCSFALVDASSGRGIVQFTPPIYQKTDKASPNFVFGGCVEAQDLDPIDHFIGELVERAARDFVSMIVPVRVSYTYEVIGKGKQGEAAVRALRADDYAAALAQFEAAHHDDPKRDGHVFGMAVACELMGDPQRALQYYRQAASMPDVDEDDLPIYLAAKDRLTAHMDRIVPIKSEPRPRAPSEKENARGD